MFIRLDSLDQPPVRDGEVIQYTTQFSLCVVGVGKDCGDSGERIQSISVVARTRQDCNHRM